MARPSAWTSNERLKPDATGQNASFANLCQGTGSPHLCPVGADMDHGPYGPSMGVLPALFSLLCHFLYLGPDVPLELGCRSRRGPSWKVPPITKSLSSELGATWGRLLGGCPCAYPCLACPSWPSLDTVACEPHHVPAQIPRGLPRSLPGPGWGLVLVGKRGENPGARMACGSPGQVSTHLGSLSTPQGPWTRGE